MKRSEIILHLAPSFRDRFDFSMPAQYQEWLDMTATAAEPFVKLIADEELAHRSRVDRIKELEVTLKDSQIESYQLKILNAAQLKELEEVLKTNHELAKAMEAKK